MASEKECQLQAEERLFLQGALKEEKNLQYQTSLDIKLNQHTKNYDEGVFSDAFLYLSLRPIHRK